MLIDYRGTAPRSVDHESTRNDAMRKQFARLTLLAVLAMGVGLFTPNAAAHPPDPFTIVNHYSRLVADVPDPTDFVFTVLWDYWGGSNQHFDIVRVDPNNPNSDVQLRVQKNGQCLDVNNASGADGARVQTFWCHGGPSQLWFFETTTDPTVVCGPGMFCDNVRTVIRARHSGKCLDAWNPNPSRTNLPKRGAALQQWTCLNNVNQFWDINGGHGPH
ncbi:RICIN domain-containing protein [Nocardia sp. NPDC057353]|uniref:RICIN domain-containing protein n=1 Tax=Nocardia sp. NPDC057353 TaxID=3346104 RepID=UPI00364182FC